MLKQIWLHSVKWYLKIGLFFYFRRIHVYGLENLLKDKPTLLLSNHQNALLDALIIASKLNYFAYFLTRAGVFKKQFVARLLATFNMLPVYRIRDGWSNLTNNNPVFDKCRELLHAGETVVIFPEGSHNLVRRVRPLSKGFTRIVFDTLETYPDLDLQLLPVGLNFVNAKDFVDSTVIYIGEPFHAKDYVSENRNASVVNLKADVHKAICQLTTHIPEENYEEILNKLNTLQVDYLNPKEVNACIESGFNNCKPKKISINIKFLRTYFKFFLKIGLFIPYLMWKLWIQPKIKELEFTSTFRFAVAVTLVPIYLISMFFILAGFLSTQFAIMFVLAIILCALFTVKL